jgi:Fe-S cluster assembly protein SufD
MTTLMAEKNLYLDQFAQFEKAQRDLPWLRRIRNAAIARFGELGLPTTRNEDWRFTNLAPLTRIPLQLAKGGVPSAQFSLDAHTLPNCHRLVFVNGRYERSLSATDGLPQGVVVTNLAQRGLYPEIVETTLARHARFEDNALTALNTAFLADGAIVYIGRNVVVDRPIQLVFLSSSGNEPFVSHPRTLVVAEANSQATIVEQYAGLEDGIYFTNAVSELVLGENAIVDHYKLQEESREAFHIANTQVVQAKSSSFTSHYIALGGNLVRNEMRALLDAEGCEATINGLYMASGKQHIDNFTVIDHAKPHCASHELYKGILDDQAHGVFNGKIFVRQDAQKTDAKQTNQVLLLSEDAVINTKPQLEIFADDVKCTHGATVGQLDADAIFYLRSRGIDLNSARKLLTYAFANDIISRIKIDALRERLEHALTTRPKTGNAL